MRGLKRLIYIQLFLVALALASGIGCAVLGAATVYGRLDHYYVRSASHGSDMIGVPLEVETGHNGGAIGLGILAACCVLSVVWIEVTKFKSEK